MRETAKTFKHNVVWDSLYCAVTKMSMYMIPVVEILVLLFYCVND